jgi:hypothetical protein
MASYLLDIHKVMLVFSRITGRRYLSRFWKVCFLGNRSLFGHKVGYKGALAYSIAVCTSYWLPCNCLFNQSNG